MDKPIVDHNEFLKDAVRRELDRIPEWLDAIREMRFAPMPPYLVCDHDFDTVKITGANIKYCPKCRQTFHGV